MNVELTPEEIELIEQCVYGYETEYGPMGKEWEETARSLLQKLGREDGYLLNHKG